MENNDSSLETSWNFKAFMLAKYHQLQNIVSSDQRSVKSGRSGNSRHSARSRNSGRSVSSSSVSISASFNTENVKDSSEVENDSIFKYSTNDRVEHPTTESDMHRYGFQGPQGSDMSSFLAKEDSFDHETSDIDPDVSLTIDQELTVPSKLDTDYSDLYHPDDYHDEVTKHSGYWIPKTSYNPRFTMNVTQYSQWFDNSQVLEWMDKPSLEPTIIPNSNAVTETKRIEDDEVISVNANTPSSFPIKKPYDVDSNCEQSCGGKMMDSAATKVTDDMTIADSASAHRRLPKWQRYTAFGIVCNLCLVVIVLAVTLTVVLVSIRHQDSTNNTLLQSPPLPAATTSPSPSQPTLVPEKEGSKPSSESTATSPPKQV